MNGTILQRNAYIGASEFKNTLIPPQRHNQQPPYISNEHVTEAPASSEATVILAPMQYLHGTYSSSASTTIIVETATAIFATHSSSLSFGAPSVGTPLDQPSYATSTTTLDSLTRPPTKHTPSDDGSVMASSTTETLEVTIASSEFTTMPGGISPAASFVQISTTLLSALHAPQVTSASFQTSKMTSSSTASHSATPYPPWHGSPQCDQDPKCKGATKQEEDYRGEIAGSVIGVIGFIVLIFAVVMLCRRRSRRNKRKNIEDTAICSDKVKADSQSSTSHTNNDSSDHTITNQPRGRIRQKSLELLGEPGPAISMDGAIKSLHQKAGPYPIAQARSHNHSLNHIVNGSTSSNVSASSNPFRTPTDTDENSIPDLSQPARSSIGLALTRYLTTDTSHAQCISHPQSPPKPVEPASASAPEHASLPTSTSPKEQQNKSISQQLNSQISLSAQTAPKDPEEPVICNARIVTARRHSFTPRIINIVAGQNGKDAPNNDSNVNESPEPRMASMRARSASPQKAPAYSGSPAKLNAHFGIQIWGMQTGRTSSERRSLGRTGSNGSVRGRRIERAQERGEGQANCPPRSYPKLGRSLSAVKRTIRADQERAFSGMGNCSLGLVGKDVEALPESITVRRGGNGKGKVGSARE